jgi:amino acid permease
MTNASGGTVTAPRGEADNSTKPSRPTAESPLLAGAQLPTSYGGHEGDFVTENEDRDLSRGLHQRHVSLIAIAGAIGTGLFVGLGGAVQTAGPLGALLGYLTVGLIVCAVQFALGEVTALLPVTGSFVRHAEFLIDPAVGFAIGWNIVCILHDWCSLAILNRDQATDSGKGLRQLVIYSSRDLSHLCAL